MHKGLLVRIAAWIGFPFSQHAHVLNVPHQLQLSAAVNVLFYDVGSHLDAPVNMCESLLVYAGHDAVSCLPDRLHATGQCLVRGRRSTRR